MTTRPAAPAGHPADEAGSPKERKPTPAGSADKEGTDDPFEKKPSRHAPFDIGHEREIPGAPSADDA